ncbi:pyruvate kinase [Escherichia coli]
MSRRLRRTKIVTTLGPATDRDNNLEKVIAAGLNVVRMNFSHGSPEDHKMRADKVREIAAKLGRHVAILGDLQGPKIRVSTFKEGKVFLNLGINSCSTPTWVKVKATRKKLVLTTKACLLTSCLVTSCCWTMVASS